MIDTTTSQVVEVDYYYRKYYYAGNTRIAMRYYEDGVPTQYWLLSDQVNSQSVTLNEEGTLHSEVRYTPFGETRYTSQTDTPTDYLYTGQRLEEELGLYFYNARFYDASLIHFNQPDTIIPGMENPISWHRYAYVNFNPLKYIDPSGHYLTEQDSLFDGSSYQSGARTRHNPKPIALFVGPWTEKGIQAVTAETNLLAIAYADAYNTEMRLLQRIGEGELQFTPLTPRAAFLRIHHGAITYTRETYSCPTGCAAMTRSLNAISVFSNVSDSYLERSHRVISHENFHAFNNATSSIAQTIFQGIYSDLLRPMIDGVIQHTDDNRGGWFGYAGGAEYWQFGYDGNQGSEEFADSGIGWLYDTWGEGDQGNLRKNRMEGQMTYFLFSLLWNGR